MKHTGSAREHAQEEFDGEENDADHLDRLERDRRVVLHLVAHGTRLRFCQDTTEPRLILGARHF